MKNALTIDLEDWYHGVFSLYKGNSMPELEDRLLKNSYKVLEILNETGTKATFFILGKAVEKHPHIIEMIHKEGHEIGTHGYGHQLVYNMTPEEFEDDIDKSIKIINDAVKCQIEGYRAPAFSITSKTGWVYEILKKKGLSYDASIYPTKNPLYGDPNAPRFPYAVQGVENFWEIPASTIIVAGLKIPVCGGFYFRAYPYEVTKLAIKEINRSKNPAIVYVHPWEFDPGQPRLKTTLRESITHYFNLHGMEKKFKRLLKEFTFCPISDLQFENEQELYYER